MADKAKTTTNGSAKIARTIVTWIVLLVAVTIGLRSCKTIVADNSYRIQSSVQHYVAPTPIPPIDLQLTPGQHVTFPTNGKYMKIRWGEGYTEIILHYGPAQSPPYTSWGADDNITIYASDLKEADHVTILRPKVPPRHRFRGYINPPIVGYRVTLTEQ
jgi:hypothetical protein